METPVSGSDAPAWLQRVLTTPGESRQVEIAGCPIHYLRWGDPARPGLVLVPASGGHAHWFDHIAPLLADQFHVVAIDLAGCGDSGRREVYTPELVTAEIIGVCQHAGMLTAAVPPTLVGHSAGAQFAMRAAIAHDDALLGVIALDGLRYAKLAKDHAVKALSGERGAPRPARVYASLAEATARFRLRPEPLTPVVAPQILDHIAQHSYRRTEAGWEGKYDARQAATITLGLELVDALKDLKCRSAAIYAEHTHLADDTAVAVITRASEGRTIVFRMPGTSHYPPIDSPLACVAAIQGVALSWVAAWRSGWAA